MMNHRRLPKLSPRGARGIALAASLLMAAGCGSSSSPTTPTTQPAGPSKAAITVSYSGVTWNLGGVSGFTYSLGFTITVRETAGVGAKGNFLRADFYDGGNGTGNRVERQEVGGSVLGHLSPNGNETAALLVGFNTGSTSSVVLTFNVTDDKGNVLENSQTFNCCG